MLLSFKRILIINLKGTSQLLEEYIIAIIPGWSAGAIVVLSYFLIKLWRAYNKYRFFVLKLKAIQTIVGILSIACNAFAMVCETVMCGLILYDIGLITVIIILDIEIIFIHLLRRERVSKLLIYVIASFTLIKALSLIGNPFKIIKLYNFYFREPHLKPGSVFISLILMFLLFAELLILIYKTPKRSWRRNMASKILLLYGLALIFPAIFYVKPINDLQIIIPFFESINTSLFYAFIMYYFLEDPEYLHLLPVDLYGVLLTTFNGVSIFELCFDERFDRAINLAKSIMLSLLTVDMPRGKELSGTLRVFNFSRFQIIFYISYFVVGVFVSNISNAVLVNVLKNITNEYEQLIKYPGDSLITDEEREVARSIVEKYIKLLI